MRPDPKMLGYPVGKHTTKMYFVWQQLVRVDAQSHGFNENFGDKLLTPRSFQRFIPGHPDENIVFLLPDDEDERAITLLYDGEKREP